MPTETTTGVSSTAQSTIQSVVAQSQEDPQVAIVTLPSRTSSPLFLAGTNAQGNSQLSNIASPQDKSEEIAKPKTPGPDLPSNLGEF